MRKLVMLSLLVMLLGSIVPTPALAGEPYQTDEPVELIGVRLDIGEPEVPSEGGIVAGMPEEDLVGAELHELTPNVIVGGDNRERVWTTTTDPYRAVVHLEIVAADDKLGVCTGFFIRPRTIMTAGHCIYGYDSSGNPVGGRGWVKTVKVIPARSWERQNGKHVELKPFGEDDAFYLYTTTAWAQSSQPVDENGNYTYDNDYGFVLLPDQTLFNRINTLFGVQSFARNVDDQITISGYPVDKSWCSPLGGTQYPPDTDRDGSPDCPKDASGKLLFPEGLWEMWTHSGRISEILPLQFRTDMVDTNNGQSGSPCWYTYQGEQWSTSVAVGVWSNYNYWDDDGDGSYDKDKDRGRWNACVALRPQIVNMIGQLP
ncbi:MAG: trypsin-like serine peptidase [Anaerolineae bacterium]